MFTTLPAPFGRYQLRTRLGSGSYGVVYQAYDPRCARLVALKLLLPQLAADVEAHGRFLAEARIMASLHHPAIVPVHDTDTVDGLPFFTMAFVAGPSLATLLRAGRPLSLEHTQRLVTALATALDYLHGRQIIHRDVKPANVMLTPTGHVQLMDFGISLAPDRTRWTQAGVGMGTAEYAAPEQIRGAALGPAVDIYALGVLTYELLAATPPFSGTFASVLHAQAYLPPPPLEATRPDLPQAVCAAIWTALAKEPADRWPSAGTFAAALRSAAAPLARQPVPSAAAVLSATAAAPLRRATGGMQPTAGRLHPPGPPPTLLVSPRKPGAYPTLQAALRVAPPGATIRVRPGYYRESITLERSVALLGDGPAERIVLENPPGSRCLVQTAGDAATLLQGLSLRCTGPDSGISLTGGSVVLEDCRLSAMAVGLSCVWVGPLDQQRPGPQVTLRRCQLRAHTGDGIYFAGASLELEDCIIAAQQSGLDIVHGQITAAGCVIHGCAEGISISGQASVGSIRQCTVRQCIDGIIEYGLTRVRIEACELRENGRDWFRLTKSAE